MMVVMMIFSYAITAFFDLKATFYKEGKYKLAVYFILMAISCTIGIMSAYVEDMPSPADPIKQIVFAVMGK